MAKKRAFVKYTKKGEIIPGSLIVTTKGGYPSTGLYTEVPVDLCCGYTPFTPTTPVKTRAFVKYTKKGKIIPGSLVVTTKGGYPVDGLYVEVSTDLCCNPNPNFNRIIVSLDSAVTLLGLGCTGRTTPVTIYLTQECLDNIQVNNILVGCEVWLNEEATILAGTGDFRISAGKWITVIDGVVTTITIC